MPLDPQHLNHIRAFETKGSASTRDRQAALRAGYKSAPETAWVHDHARTSDAEIPASHPTHGHVICGKGLPLDLPVSVHREVGGESDFPCPGEILAAALASCLDTAIRMIARLKGVGLERLEVRVTLGADVRGALMMGEDVPVGFQTARIKVDMRSDCGLSEARLQALLDAAEQSCVILQTLRAPPTIRIERCLGDTDASQAR